MQKSVYPDHSVLKLKGYDFCFVIEPASYLSGDCFDFLKAKDKFYMIIGDISGHGLFSGILMLLVQYFIKDRLRNIEARHTSTLDVIGEVNRYLFEKSKDIGFVCSMTLSIIEFKKDSLTLSGYHEKFIRVRESDVSVYTTASYGNLLGVSSKISINSSTLLLDVLPGDKFIFYTDGVTEAENIKGSQYTFDSLLLSVKKHKDLPIKTLIYNVNMDFMMWYGKVEFLDDFILVGLEKT